MNPEVVQNDWMIAAYWLLMFPIAVFVLMRVANFWADEGPSTVLEAVRAILLLGVATFLAYDLSGYMFARLMQVPQLGFVFPDGYTYWDWIWEPLYLKWQVLGFVPMIRYLPVLFAVTVGGTVQMWLWDVSFRLGVLAFVSQIILTVTAMAAMSLLFSFFVGMGEGAQTTTPSSRNNERRSTASQQQRDQNFDQNHVSNAPNGLAGMQVRAREIGLRQGPFINEAWERWESVNHQFESGYAWARPFTRYLPSPVQDWIERGGWLIAGPALAAFGWYVLRRRNRRHGNNSSNPIETNRSERG